MASIKTSIELFDSISSPLLNITNALNMTVSAFEEMQDVANNTFNASSLNAVRDSLNQATIGLDEMAQGIDGAKQEQERLNNSFRDGTNAASGLERKIAGFIAAYATVQSLQRGLSISDEMTQTTARLNLMNDGLQTTKELQDMIFLSAERSRAKYQATADMVSQLGMNAKDAFSSNVELISFAEQLNKSLVIAGTSGQGMESVIYNLTQALSTGVLRGQDLNAVMSNAPNIIQNIADYLEVPIGQIREMAAQGQITADIVKKSMIAATDKINEQFESMPMTFAQIATSIQNNVLMAFRPVLEELNALANSEHFQNLVNGIINSLVFVSGVVLEIFNLVAQVGSFIYDNWSILDPLIMGAATALGIYTAALVIFNGVQAFTNFLKGIAAMQANIHAAALMMESGATFAATAAQHGFNAALFACPITWIILAIIALVAILYLAVAAFNKLAGTSISATGIIVGVLAVGAAFIGNLFVALINFIIDIIAVLWNAIASFAEFFANVFNDPVGSIIRLFQRMADAVLGILESIAAAIDTIFNSNLAAAVSGWRGSLSGMVADLVGDAKISIPRMDTSSLRLDNFEYKSAWDAGYSFGEGIDEKIGNFDIGSFFDTNIPSPSDFITDYMGGANPEGYSGGADPSSVPGSARDTADNTKAIKDSVELSQEDLKYLRDIAETEVVNRFTTAEIKVEQTNYNTIDSEIDLDGVVSYLTESLNEAMNKAAEGVHI